MAQLFPVTPPVGYDTGGLFPAGRRCLPDLRSSTNVTEGGHTWMNARHYLPETLP